MDESEVTLSTDESEVTLSTDESEVTLSTDESEVTLSTDESKTALAALPSIITKHGLSMLLEILGLNHPVQNSADCAVIVVIDFEGTNTIRNGFALKENCQVGFAMLDTKLLRQPGDQPDVALAQLISTSNFAAGTPSYIAKASNRFLFGDTVAIRGRASSIKHAIQLHIPQDRNIVLVGHSIIYELRAFENLGFKFGQPPLAILDTHRIANEVLGFWGGSLGDLLTMLACPFPFDRLHVAGNDAHFTLRALLLLAAKWCISQGQKDEILDILLDISYSPIPSIFKKQAVTRRAKRKNQPKSWDKEKQDSIRDKRETQRLQHKADGEGDYMLDTLELDYGS